jgi:hypothetical protein
MFTSATTARRRAPNCPRRRPGTRAGKLQQPTRANRPAAPAGGGHSPAGAAAPIRCEQSRVIRNWASTPQETPQRLRCFLPGFPGRSLTCCSPQSSRKHDDRADSFLLKQCAASAGCVMVTHVECKLLPGLSIVSDRLLPTCRFSLCRTRKRGPSATSGNRASPNSSTHHKGCKRAAWLNRTDCPRGVHVQTYK